MTTCSLLLAAAVVACVVVVVSPVSAEEPNLCPWRTVDRVDSTFIQNLGKWAVEQTGTPFRFDKVESARVQGVGECTGNQNNYELIIDASNRAGPGDDRYKAVVFVMDQKLVSFRPV